jgi:glyoxylase-like metal-dependent hydrolase (beta-lactamase superfamily II)
MELFSINTGHFKLDGGAMFGVVPKSIWQRLNPADENNMCSWAMRCLLVKDGNRLILIDNGMGNKQNDKFFGYYFLHGNDTLDLSLAKYGFCKDDITDVFLTHLHFDHCGGSIEYNSDRTKLKPAFNNATYWCAKKHWDWAVNPNPREKASFLSDNILPIQESGQLKFIDSSKEFMTDFNMYEANGHTEAMLLPLIKYKDTTIAFMADLIPSVGHLPLPYVMGYDVRPLNTMQEKDYILHEAAKNNWTLFFEHDPINECCNVIQTEKGIRADKIFKLEEL